MKNNDELTSRTTYSEVGVPVKKILSNGTVIHYGLTGQMLTMIKKDGTAYYYHSETGELLQKRNPDGVVVNYSPLSSQ